MKKKKKKNKGFKYNKRDKKQTDKRARQQGGMFDSIFKPQFAVDFAFTEVNSFRVLEFVKI